MFQSVCTWVCVCACVCLGWYVRDKTSLNTCGPRRKEKQRKKERWCENRRNGGKETINWMIANWDQSVTGVTGKKRKSIRVWKFADERKTCRRCGGGGGWMNGQRRENGEGEPKSWGLSRVRLACHPSNNSSICENLRSNWKESDRKNQHGKLKPRGLQMKNQDIESKVKQTHRHSPF